MNFTILSIGSNIGERLRYILAAIDMLPLKLSRISNLYKSKALLPAGAPKYWDMEFLNIAVSGRTSMSCQDFIKTIKQIENILNRNREHTWAPRTIDIDIIFWNNNNLQSKMLTIPHQYAHERDFVMVPICDIYPSFVHPKFQKTVSLLGTSLKKSSLNQVLSGKKIMTVHNAEKNYLSLGLS